MKKSSRVHLILSLAVGILFGLGSLFVMRWFRVGGAGLAIATGLLFAWLLFGALQLNESSMRKRYAEAEKLIISPIWLQTNGNVRTGTKVRNANIYFCEEGIVLISLDQRPFALEEIPVNLIESYEFSNFQFLIRTTDERLFVIQSPESNRIRNELRRKEWI